MSRWSPAVLSGTCCHWKGLLFFSWRNARMWQKWGRTRWTLNLWTVSRQNNCKEQTFRGCNFFFFNRRIDEWRLCSWRFHSWLITGHFMFCCSRFAFPVTPIHPRVYRTPPLETVWEKVFQPGRTERPRWNTVKIQHCHGKTLFIKSAIVSGAHESALNGLRQAARVSDKMTMRQKAGVEGW